MAARSRARQARRCPVEEDRPQPGEHRRQAEGAGDDPGRHDEGPARLRDRVGLRRAAGYAGLVGEPVPRPGWTADRIGPVRLALLGHARRFEGADAGRGDGPEDRVRARPAVGVRLALRHDEQPRQVRLGLLPLHRYRRRRPARQREEADHVQGRRRRAWPARDRAHRERRRAVPRIGQPDRAVQDHQQPRPGDLGRGHPDAARVRQGLHAGQARPRRLRPAGRSRRRRAGAGQHRLPQPVRRRPEPSRRPVHLRRRHGVGLEHPLVPADPRLPDRQRQRLRLAERLGQMAGPLARQLPADDRHRTGQPDRRHLRLRSRVPGQVPGRAVCVRLDVRQAVRHPPDRTGGRLRRQEGRVRHRHAAAFDGCDHQPARRGDVLRPRRTADQVRSVPREVHRRRVDRAGRAGAVDPAAA